MLNKIYESSKYVKDNSEHVTINYKVIDEFIKDFKEPTFWLNSNPFNILELDVKDIINFLLIIHTIGDYCFWCTPKWEIDYNNKKLDGYYAVMYLILKRYQANKDFNMSYEEFAEFLKGNVTIPLLKERYDALKIMNKYLDTHDFYDSIKNLTTDEDLFEYIISNFPYFKDTRTYKGKTIYLYKRAGLLVSDILHTRELLENIKVNYNDLIGCADYKIPQVMNSLGMLEYSKKLNNKISNYEELEVNSEEEIEIRANTLMVIDYIYHKLNKKIPRIDINDYIWLLGQDKTKITIPYHRTKTTNY